MALTWTVPDRTASVAMVASKGARLRGHEASIPMAIAARIVARFRHDDAKGDKIVQKPDDGRRRHGYEPRS
jgi:hypothetical protein